MVDLLPASVVETKESTLVLVKIIDFPVCAVCVSLCVKLLCQCEWPGKLCISLCKILQLYCTCIYTLNFSARHSLNFLVGLECTISWVCGHETDYTILYYSTLYWLMLSDPCSAVIPLSTQSQSLNIWCPELKMSYHFNFHKLFSDIIYTPYCINISYCMFAFNS